jgi:hypothetical protein
MNSQRLALTLTALNLALLTVTLSQNRPLAAQGVPAVLRGRALELVDDRGRVRAEIKVLPADPNVRMPDGTRGYPETVQLRLIDSEGGPNVKLGATEDGAGLVLGGDAGYVQILSRKGSPFVKLVNKNGPERTIGAADAAVPK